LSGTIFNDICFLSDILCISEQESLSLYYFMSTQRDSLESFDKTWKEMNISEDQQHTRTITSCAIKFYFYERSLLLRTTLLLLQYRQNSTAVVVATDNLLQRGLITNLVKLIREYTTLIKQLQQKIESISQRTEITPSQSASQQQLHFEEHLEFSFQERQIATECLYFIAYDVQLTALEIADILDLVKDLTNGTAGSTPDGIGLHQLNPFTDVPDPYEHVPETTTQAYMVSMTKSPWTQQRKEKDSLEWQHQLVESVHRTGYPALLRCVSTLIVTCMVALDAHNVLMDRNTHASNIFGKVRHKR
jgi:hypothetical protein